MIIVSYSASDGEWNSPSELQVRAGVIAVAHLGGFSQRPFENGARTFSFEMIAATRSTDALSIVMVCGCLPYVVCMCETKTGVTLLLGEAPSRRYETMIFCDCSPVIPAKAGMTGEQLRFFSRQ